MKTSGLAPDQRWICIWLRISCTCSTAYLLGARGGAGGAEGREGCTCGHLGGGGTGEMGDSGGALGGASGRDSGGGDCGGDTSSGGRFGEIHDSICNVGGMPGSGGSNPGSGGDKEVLLDRCMASGEVLGAMDGDNREMKVSKLAYASWQCSADSRRRLHVEPTNGMAHVSSHAHGKLAAPVCPAPDLVPQQHNKISDARKPVQYCRYSEYMYQLTDRRRL